LVFLSRESWFENIDTLLLLVWIGDGLLAVLHGDTLGEKNEMKQKLISKNVKIQQIKNRKQNRLNRKKRRNNVKCQPR
jgi:hypothetical protein